MPKTDAQKRANKKYMAKTYKRCAVNVRKEKLDEIEKYKAEQGIESDSGIFLAALKYCMENNIDLKK